MTTKDLILVFFLITAAENSFSQQGPVHFKMQRVSAETYESVGVFDVDGDEKPDIVSGGFWYKGLAFKQRYSIREVKRTGEYFDDFMTLPLDINGDGRMDYVSGGWFGGVLYWYENTGRYEQNWPEHIVAITGSIETARTWDVDGDGVLEIVPNNPGRPFRFYRLNLDAKGKGTGIFTEHILYGIQGHGLGFGDINKDGRNDFVLADGWLEAPENPLIQKWEWHPEFSLNKASIPILVVDVNSDGHNDLIVGQAHGYGLDWYEHTTPGNWKKHIIDPYNSQFHTMDWKDLDGDGKSELITGKRYRAHNDNDPGAQDDYGIYYYKWDGEAFRKQIIIYGALGAGKATGNQIKLADLNADGKIDLVAAGKDGLCIFFNEGIKQ